MAWRPGEWAFELTYEEWVEQADRNREEMTHYMHQLGNAIGLSDIYGSDGKGYDKGDNGTFDK